MLYMFLYYSCDISMTVISLLIIEHIYQYLSNLLITNSSLGL